MNPTVLLAAAFLITLYGHSEAGVIKGDDVNSSISKRAKRSVLSIRAHHTNCRTVVGPARLAEGQSLQNLDRHHVNCDGTDEFLVSWRLQRQDPNKYNYQSMVYKCCQISFDVPNF
ncbi:unnamed protein product [Owenia fusiformis]|uniref:Uncharacterized protein n=1 Tax=Owenia fusiformis TaxID=6347 RepID=A0A8J1XKL2_OWEFU|nr:unnamed protein product [Owenia fusiformis]